MGQDINIIFNQKLLYNNENDNFQMGVNLEQEKAPTQLQYFCNKSFFKVLEEDNKIYSLYLEGGDYEDTLNKKKERENNEREERNKLYEGDKKTIQDTEEEIGLGNQINDNEEGNNGEQENNQNEKEENEAKEVAEEKEKKDENEAKKAKEEENFENQDPFDSPEIESSSEETEEDKNYNDPNYWGIKSEMKPEEGENLIKDLILD